MSIRVALYHKTEYVYDRPVTLLPQIVRLRPAPHCRTPIVGYSLRIHPAEHFINWQQDPYSNYLARLVFPKATHRFTVEVDLVAQMVAINPFDFFLEESARTVPFSYEEGVAQELQPYLEIQESGHALLEFVASVRSSGKPTIDFLVELNQKLQQHIGYIIRMEPGVQTCEETLTKRSGSCRDSAWLLVQILRHLGFAARFVSGYLIQLTADQPALEGPSGPTTDFTDLHAWTEVYLPGAGWIGLDPTSGLLAGEGHIPLACTAEPQNAAPITGAYSWTKVDDDDELDTTFSFDMSLQRIHELPRVTKPYTEEQWQAIDRTGSLIDRDLEAGDVRLTMGGEPTFVAIDHRDSAEWNTAALGPTKKQYADVLLRRLRDRYLPGGLLHFGQGKWYPGESLPRWAFGCYGRVDGVPIWEDPKLVADEAKNYGHGAIEARAFGEQLARILGVQPNHCIPGFEDVWYYMWRERRLPINVDPLQSRLEEPEERARLARVFEQGLHRIIGYALPLRKEHNPEGSFWRSGEWFLRREHLFLIPGDSPMGFRLPLDSLPWVRPEIRDHVIEPDPWSPRGQLPPKEQPRTVLRDAEPKPVGDGPVPLEIDGVIRTALCIEPRDGKLRIFMPPVSRTEDYLELVAAIETTAKTLQLPVMIEGYPPPYDPRLKSFKVTPDPGVIEVNVMPSANWPELVESVSSLYEEARQSRLCAEKFMIDGRHVGTGGGNHIILGGATPADSPILRRPDLLRSLLAYWHNHPSLSYLFAGLFIGPTSQAPRVDEARNDSLYELEIAFDQIPEQGPIPPWLVDRIFRNLLIDVTGNTHRSEWCIDKLFSPDTTTGRLGLVEFRAFEMPPHARMSLVQHLLLRALIARFWRQPYRHKLVRWGTQLHDRFMLPHFIEQDFRDVLEETRLAGYPLDDAWFAPHLEFKFPLYGRVHSQGVELELRQAMEPWHVMGEEPTAGGTARYVDSSVERLQVKVRGMIDPRHIVLCHGRRVPLHPTGVHGEYVAGVRFRGWQPPSCLHPTIPVHSPLVFDLYDTWMNRAITGCTYYVAHPGGRSFETLPVNANEAEGRRIARFFPMGHTPDQINVPVEETLAEFPFTLDLRTHVTEPPQTFSADSTSRRGGSMRKIIKGTSSEANRRTHTSG